MAATVKQDRRGGTTPHKCIGQPVALEKYDATAQERAVMLEDGRLVTVQVPTQSKKKKTKKKSAPVAEGDSEDGIRITSSFDKKSPASDKESLSPAKQKADSRRNPRPKDTSAQIAKSASSALSKEHIAMPEEPQAQADNQKNVTAKADLKPGKKAANAAAEKEKNAKTSEHEPAGRTASPRLSRRIPALQSQLSAASPSPLSARTAWRTKPMPGGPKPNDVLHMLFQMWPMQRTRSYRPPAQPPKKQRSARQTLGLARKWSRRKRRTRVAGLTVEASVMISKKSSHGHPGRPPS